jgi:photosystem II stability/assembly factor-like uncharacterized protein
MDGGRTWTPQSLPSQPGWPGVSFSNETLISVPEFFDALHGVLSVNGTSGFGVPNGLVVYVTRDGGQTWVPTTRPTTDRSAYFAPVSATTWLAAGDGRLYRTVDGGQHWATLQANVAFDGITELRFTSPTRGWALQGPNGASEGVAGVVSVLRTDNGGRTWVQVTSSP